MSLNNKLIQFNAEIVEQYDFPHVICKTETWLSNSTPNSVFHCQHKYDIYRKDRKGIGGGVAIFVRKDVKSREISSNLFDPLELVVVSTKIGGRKLFLLIFIAPALKILNYFNNH